MTIIKTKLVWVDLERILGGSVHVGHWQEDVDIQITGDSGATAEPVETADHYLFKHQCWVIGVLPQAEVRRQVRAGFPGKQHFADMPPHVQLDLSRWPAFFTPEQVAQLTDLFQEMAFDSEAWRAEQRVQPQEVPALSAA